MSCPDPRRIGESLSCSVTDSLYVLPTCSERSKNKGPDRPHEAVDRDQRLKDATALAAADAESLAQRPRSAHRSRSISAAVPSAGQQQQQQPKSTGGFRPTSAGSAAPAFGGASRRKEWQAISSMAQIGDAEEEADWQSRALAHFVFIEPGTGKIRFSSPRLPAEWAAGALFFTILEKTNPPYMVNNIKKLIKQGDHFEVGCCSLSPALTCGWLTRTSLLLTVFSSKRRYTCSRARKDQGPKVGWCRCPSHRC